MRPSTRWKTIMGAVHRRVATGGGKAIALNENFRTVHTLIGSVNTAHTSTYRAIRFARYRHHYLGEAQLRCNQNYQLCAMLGCLLHARVATPRLPERGTGVAEVHRQSGIPMSVFRQPLPPALICIQGL